MSLPWHGTVAPVESGVLMQERQFAGWWRRVLATLIDQVSWFVGMLLAAGVQLAGAPQFIYSPLAALGIVWFFVAVPGTMKLTNGRTPGKWVLRIRVVRTSGAPTGFWWSFLREWPVKGVLSLIPLLDVLWPLWDKEKRALHDMVVNSRVVRSPPA